MSPSPPPARLPLLLRTVVLALAAVLVVAGCGAGRAGLVTRVARLLPPDLADRGVVVDPGGRPSDRVLALLDADADAVDGIATTGAPEVLVVLGDLDDGAVTDALTGAGYTVTARVDGWTVLDRGALEDPAQLGIPAVAVTDGVVVVGGAEEVASVAGEHAAPLAVPAVTALDEEPVAVAVLATPATVADPGAPPRSGRLPDWDVALLVATEGGTGEIALVTAAGSQEAAADLALRVTTATDGGRPLTDLVEPGGPLWHPDEGVLALPVTWREPADELLPRLLDRGVLALLAPG